MRIGVIHNSNTTLNANSVSIAKIYDVAMKTMPLTLSKSFVTKIVKEEFAGPLIKGKLQLEELAVHVSYLATIHFQQFPTISCLF